ncbi:MAG: RES family NAD+ phosphorylase [Rhizobiaceae bacterium]
MKQDIANIPVSHIEWPGAVRIIRSLYPPIDLFEDIADPADWPLLIAAEQKTNPRLMESIGNLDLVPPERRVSGPGASWLMAPFTHISTDRPSRFSNGTYGVLYAGREFKTALFETIYHHERFMAATNEEPGWTSQFREIVVDIDANLHDLRGDDPSFPALHHASDYSASQSVGASLRADGSDGVVYRSVRHEEGECAGLFWPDLAAIPRQGRHLDYHWNGTRVDYFRAPETGAVWAVG